MNDLSPFLKLTLPMLSGLATALEMGRLKPPFQTLNLGLYLSPQWVTDITREMNQLTEKGMTTNHIAYLLRMLIAERKATQFQQDKVDLVWSGLEASGMESRDTQIVVQELFERAERNVLIATYAIDQDKKAEIIFTTLAQKLDHNPGFQVQIFLNISRPYSSQTPKQQILKDFSKTFKNHIWPGNRLPELFYDPRALSLGFGPKACLHAKCIVVDDLHLLITSANFTEAAHRRNLEAGVLLADAIASKAIQNQFNSLVKKQQLKRLEF